jgi:predicted RNase H-like nuclease (RuvC/YqgF family)
MKLLLAWLSVVGLLIGVGWLYFAGQKKEVELAALRGDREQLQQVLAELQETKSARAHVVGDEVVRLRKDNEELLRLRNEVGELRKEKQQLAAQVQAAQAEANASRSNPSAQATTQAEEQQAEAHHAQTRALAVSYGLDPNLATREDQQAFECINNLREIDGAKQMWALENRRSADALPTAADIAPYLKTMPLCAAGGAYTINPVNVPPTCSISRHALPK